MAMRDGICTECGSDNIYIRNGWFHNMIVMFSPPRTNIYVCGACGYLAEYIEEGGHLDYVRNNWKRYETPTSPEKRKRDEVNDQ